MASRGLATGVLGRSGGGPVDVARAGLRSHWLVVLMLLVPTLRLLRLVTLLRLGRALPAARVVSSWHRATGTARHLLRSRLGYVGALSALMAIAVAELAFVFERGHGDTFSSFADALLWALAVVVAMQETRCHTAPPAGWSCLPASPSVSFWSRPWQARSAPSSLMTATNAQAPNLTTDGCDLLNEAVMGA